MATQTSPTAQANHQHIDERRRLYASRAGGDMDKPIHQSADLPAQQDAFAKQPGVRTERMRAVAKRPRAADDDPVAVLPLKHPCLTVPSSSKGARPMERTRQPHSHTSGGDGNTLQSHPTPQQHQQQHLGSPGQQTGTAASGCTTAGTAGTLHLMPAASPGTSARAAGQSWELQALPDAAWGQADIAVHAAAGMSTPKLLPTPEHLGPPAQQPPPTEDRMRASSIAGTAITQEGSMPGRPSSSAAGWDGLPSTGQDTRRGPPQPAAAGAGEAVLACPAVAVPHKEPVQAAHSTLLQSTAALLQATAGEVAECGEMSSSSGLVNMGRALAGQPTGQRGLQGTAAAAATANVSLTSSTVQHAVTLQGLQAAAAAAPAAPACAEGRHTAQLLLDGASAGGTGAGKAFAAVQAPAGQSTAVQLQPTAVTAAATAATAGVVVAPAASVPGQAAYSPMLQATATLLHAAAAVVAACGSLTAGSGLHTGVRPLAGQPSGPKVLQGAAAATATAHGQVGAMTLQQAAPSSPAAAVGAATAATATAAASRGGAMPAAAAGEGALQDTQLPATANKTSQPVAAPVAEAAAGAGEDEEEDDDHDLDDDDDDSDDSAEWDEKELRYGSEEECGGENACGQQRSVVERMLERMRGATEEFGGENA